LRDLRKSVGNSWMNILNEDIKVAIERFAKNSVANGDIKMEEDVENVLFLFKRIYNNLIEPIEYNQTS